MNDITLVTVNWNQQPCIELLLKSYVYYHRLAGALKIILVDNGSTDGSKEWLMENNIPFVDLPENIGHENALNHIYKEIKTKFVLLCDTDIEFHRNVFGYLGYMNDECISVGELIDKNYMNEIKIKDRISPWFWLFDIEAMKGKGMIYFRDPKVEDWTYDVGSWHWEKMKEFGFANYNIHRKHWNQDNEIVSMPYERFDHIGKVSWDVYGKHRDRIGEVEKRREYIKERLKQYSDMSINDKFIQ